MTSLFVSIRAKLIAIILLVALLTIVPVYMLSGWLQNQSLKKELAQNICPFIDGIFTSNIARSNVSVFSKLSASSPLVTHVASIPLRERRSASVETMSFSSSTSNTFYIQFSSTQMSSTAYPLLKTQAMISALNSPRIFHRLVISHLLLSQSATGRKRSSPYLPYFPLQSSLQALEQVRI